MQELPKQIIEKDIPYDGNDSEAFVYKFTNLKNQKIYIGYHKGKPYDGYYHSSTNKDFNADFTHPDGEFKYEVLMYGSENYMKQVEYRNLKDVDAANNEMYYNKTNGASSMVKADPELMDDIAKEISNINQSDDKSFCGVKITYKKLDELPDFALQIRDFTIDGDHVNNLKDIINTKNTLEHLLTVTLKDRTYRGRKGDLTIDGNHSIKAARKSKHGRSGLMPVLEIPYDIHKDWTDLEVEMLAGFLNPRSENPRLETNIETMGQQVGSLLLHGYDLQSAEVIAYKKRMNVNTVESREINKIAKEIYNKENPSDTTWIDYGQGTDDRKVLKDIIEKENKKTGVLCRTFSSDKFGITESVEKMYEYINEGITIDTYKILFYFKDSDKQNAWFKIKEKMYMDTLTWLFKPHGISVEFEYLPTTRSKFTDKKIVNLDS